MSEKKITPKSILRSGKKEVKITLENLLEHASSDNVSDALKNLYGTTGVIESVTAIDKSRKVIGKIVTVGVNSYDWGTGIKAIYEAEENDILFINCSDCDHAIWGELASRAAKKNNIKATVINGASRDSEEIIKLGYPVFSKMIRPNAGKALNMGTIKENVRIKDTIIKTGDILVGDYDGVVIIPQECVEETLEELNKIKAFEKKCMKKLEKEDAQLDKIIGI